MIETTRNTITCKCGNSHEIEGHVASAGARMVDGWNVVITMNNQIIDLCPSCYHKAKELAKELTSLTGNRYVSVSHLVHDLTDEELEKKEDDFPHFELVKVAETFPEGFEYIAFSQSYMSELSQILHLSDKLKGKFKGNVLIDTVAKQGQSSGRLVTVYFDGENFDLKSFDYQKSASRPLCRYLTDYYRSHPDVLEATVLNSVQVKMIRAGIPLPHHFKA